MSGPCPDPAGIFILSVTSRNGSGLSVSRVSSTVSDVYGIVGNKIVDALRPEMVVMIGVSMQPGTEKRETCASADLGEDVT